MKKIKILLFVLCILTISPVIFAKPSDKNNNQNQNENKELLTWINLGRITVSQYGEGKFSYTGDLYTANIGNLLVYQLRIDNGEQIINYAVQPYDSKEFNAVTYINSTYPYYLNVPAWYSVSPLNGETPVK